MKHPLPLTFVCLLLTGTAANAVDSAETFRAAFARALRAHDVRTLESLFAIPFRTIESARHEAGEITTADPSGLPRSLFWPDTICAIERGAIRDSGDRIIIGDNNLTARRANGELKAIGFKPAGGPYKAKPQPLASVDLKIHGARRQLAGNLEYDDVDGYDVALTSGIVLQATLERFPGNLAVVRVRNAKGSPVNAAADGRRSWTGTIPASGVYRVQVVRNTNYCDPLITYLLTLTAK